MCVLSFRQRLGMMQARKIQALLIFFAVLLLLGSVSRRGINDRFGRSSSSICLDSYMDTLMRSLITNGNGRTRTAQVKLVLILTYMRSGSSLTGDILQQSPEAFYIYEPFRSLFMLANFSSDQIHYVNGTRRSPPFNLTEEMISGLYNWFTCDISKLFTIGLMDPFLDKSKKAKQFPSCMKTEKSNGLDKHLAMQHCAERLQNACKTSDLRIIKTIRMELRAVRGLLDTLPNLKIIHLIRDPRATLVSRSRVGACSSDNGGEYGCTNIMCSRLENDALEEEIIQKQYPGRITSVFYENIARCPLKASRNMYDFIGATYTKEAEDYIFNITSAGNPDNCLICTMRRNSSAHIDAWKATMHPDFIRIVQRRCNFILGRYNYKILEEFT